MRIRDLDTICPSDHEGMIRTNVRTYKSDFSESFDQISARYGRESIRQQELSPGGSLSYGHLS